MKKTLFAALVAAIPNVAFADNLTFDAALERAAAEAPSLRGRAAGVSVAQSAAIAYGPLQAETGPATFLAPSGALWYSTR